jgi:hypothetical protein
MISFMRLRAWLLPALLVYSLCVPIWAECVVSFQVAPPEMARSTGPDDTEKNTAKITILVRGMLKSRSGAT